MRIRAGPAVPGHLFCRDSSPFCPISLQNLLPLEFAIGILQVLAQFCSSSANPSLGCTDFLQRNVPVSEEQRFVFSLIRLLSLSLFLSAHVLLFFCKHLELGPHPWLYFKSLHCTVFVSLHHLSPVLSLGRRASQPVSAVCISTGGLPEVDDAFSLCNIGASKREDDFFLGV